MIWQTSRFQIELSRPQVMGIVNVTPDSFSDGGRYFGGGRPLPRVFEHCEQLLKDGADLLDIGGESTRPGAEPVTVEEELRRVLPVVRQAVRWGVPLSVDTYKAAVMQAVLDAGADIINDVWALRQDGALQQVAQHPSCGVCLMHMHGKPQTMQHNPAPGNVLPQVTDFLLQVTQQLLAQGVDKSRIVLDPGVGFGKTVAQNFSLLAQQHLLLALGYPLLVGWSRKSSLAAVCNSSLGVVAQRDMRERKIPSIAAALLAVERGARIVRVHDVRETVQALKVWAAAQPA